MRRIFRERFLDVDDMKQQFASKPNRAELYTLFVNGEDWDTYSSLEDVKEVADDIYGKFGKSVKVVDGNGKVVYRPRFKTESRRPRGRMLKESDFDRYRPGRFIVCVDGETISRHRTKKEAFAEAENRKMAYRKRGISKEVEVIDGKTLKTLHDDFYESHARHGRMLREGSYDEGKTVWKIVATEDTPQEDTVERYFRTEKAANEAYEDMTKDSYYKSVEEPDEYKIQYNDDIELEPNYWMDGTVSWIEGDYDFGDYTVEVDGGLPTIAMKFNYNNEDADEDNEIFLQGDEADEAVNEICDIYSNGDKTPKEAVELWSRQYA